MNRSVLARQMFARGGAAFPDLNKDGNITQADILMGRGVELKQEGGIAGMMAPPPAAPAPGMEGPTLDPQMLTNVLTEAQQEIGNLDNAEDYETVMNSIRGDDATVEQRYAELADIVGEEDAAQTPESVLTLVQPAMAMAAVDQGIGGLAAEEMTEPVQGAMAQGIMSTMAPPPPPAAPPTAPPMMGGPPPANFKDGGLVRRGDNQPVLKFQDAGVVPDISGAGLNSLRFSRASESPFLDNLLLRDIVNAQAEREAQAAARAGLSPAAAAALPEQKPERGSGSRLRELVEAQKGIYREYGLGDPAARAADLEEQKNLTQAQMLFDIANTALTFAAPMQGERAGMSPAERLAMAATQTQLPQTIGARAQQQLEAKRAAEKEGRTLDLAALQSAETKLAAEVAAEDAVTLAKAKIRAKDPKPMSLIDATGTKVLGQYNINDPEDYAKAKALRAENPGSRLSTGGPNKPNTVTIEGQVIDITDMTNPKVVFGDKKLQTTTVNGQIVDYTDPANVRVIFGTPDTKTVTIKGQVIDITKPESPKVIFGDKDPTIKIVEGQVIDLSDLSNPTVVHGDPKKDTAMVNGQLIDYTDIDNPRVIYGDKDTKTTTVNGEVIDITDVANPTVIFGKPDRKTLTVKGQVIDITDPEDVKVLFGDKDRDIRVVKGQLVEVKDGQTTAIFGKRIPETGTFENMILADGKNILVKKVGETLYDVSGDPIDLSTDTYKGAVLVSKDKAFSEARLAGSMAAAAQELATMRQTEGDNEITNVLDGAPGLGLGANTDILGVETGTAVSNRTFDALKAARDGVGFYAKIKQVLSESVGGVVPAFENFGATEVEAGNFIDAVNVLGRVALASSPRFAEGEQVRLAAMFPSTDNFLANPANAVRRLVGLKRLMLQERENNLSVLASESDATIRRQAKNQNYAIDGVLKLLETIPDRGFVSEGAFQSTLDEIRRRREDR